jgi:hypothetical protein
MSAFAHAGVELGSEVKPFPYSFFHPEASEDPR